VIASARYYCLKHNAVIGDVIGVTVYTSEDGHREYGEWVVTPIGVRQQLLRPPHLVPT